MADDYRSGFRSSGGYVSPGSGVPITNHECNSVAYVPNLGFVAFHDAFPVQVISQTGKVWGAVGTERVMGEIPLLTLDGDVWGVDTQIVTYEKLVKGDMSTYPEFVNQKLGITGLTDAVNAWSAGLNEILLLETSGRVTHIPLESSQQPSASGTPSQPLNVSAEPKNERVVVSFSAPSSAGTSAVTDYAVQYYSSGNPEWRAATSFGSGGSEFVRVVSLLSNGESYVFRVAAVNASGNSQWSKPTVPATPAIQPPSAPGAPTVTPTGWYNGPGTTLPANTAFTLSWTPPSGTGGGAITGYKVESLLWPTPYYIGTTATPATTIRVGGVNDTSADIRMTLRYGLSYAFRVSAINSAGTGPSSETSAYVPLK